MGKISLFLLSFLFISPLLAADGNEDVLTTKDILATAHEGLETPTPCASRVFANALYDNTDEIDEDDSEMAVRAWAQKTMFDGDVLEEVLECLEIKSITDRLTTIAFTPIVFKFDNGREITINYTTQLKVLDQKLLLANKRSLPNGNPNPKLMDENDPGAIYINTDPAWYAIMVVEHGALNNFVGADKNNTLSMEWINNNIDSIYPAGHRCTNKSALANDHYTINEVLHKIVDLENDTNDYYVAGDVNLEWVMYAEIAADILLTVATAGVGEAGMIGLKGARATKTGLRLIKNMNKFTKSVHVQKYINMTREITKTTEKIAKTKKNLKKASKYQKALEQAENARRAGQDATKYEQKAKKILEEAKRADPNVTEDVLKNSEKMEESLKDLEKTSEKLTKELEKTLKENQELLKKDKKALDAARKNADPLSVADYDKKFDELQKLYDLQKHPKELKKANAKTIAENEKITQRIEELEKTLHDYENASSLGDYGRLKHEIHDLESVDKYIDTEKQLTAVFKYHNELRALNRPQTGNVFTKNLKRIKGGVKTIHAANNGAKMMNKAHHVARAGMTSRSAKISDWLFDATLKHGARFARIGRDIGGIYGVVAFVADMYDKTSSTSIEYSNGIEFKPLCLLSADDLEGQDNVVNYGMWLMWLGNSTDPADDDAAYLQSMDFAEKFNYVLNGYQDEHGKNCNVDIYVVRPIIRIDESNPNETRGELFYLFMNDVPWTTAD